MKSLFSKIPKFLMILASLIALLIIIPDYIYCKTMSVQGDKVNLRSNPDQNSDVLWEYGDGFPLEVLKTQGSWIMVRDFENDSGWIHKSLLQQSNQVIVKVNKNVDSNINIRSGPGTNNPVVGNAYYGVVFSVLEKKGSWIQVRHESGLTGWVKSNLLWGL